MVTVHVFGGGGYELIVIAATDDLAAFAVDQLAHCVSLLSCCKRLVIMRRPPTRKFGETLESTGGSGGETRVHLCGQLTVRLRGTRIEEDLPGRQGRVLFAYLAVHRMRTIPRAELPDILWPDAAPAAAEAGLAALLTKLRRGLGDSALVGKQELRLVLPANAWVDLEAARDGLHRAESALAMKDWARAWGPARVAAHIAVRGFMPGYTSPWVEAVRREVHDCLVRAQECVAGSALGLGGAEIATAERAARRLIEIAPLRETGYRLLMRTLVARDDVGEALLVYERLRTALREELGASPSALTQALHRQILTGSKLTASADPSRTREQGGRGEST
jgi:SARP family transcriptional regulator, regulator of embCAB operon